MRRLPPLAAVRVFEAAARHLHFTRAANELGMTQAAVSYQIKLLEERVGTALFERSGRGVALTPMGQRIAPMVSTAFDTLDDAFAQVRREEEEVLTLSCSNTFASNWLAVRLGSFQIARPGLAVRLHTSDTLVDVARGEADVVIRHAAAPTPGLINHFLMNTAMAPFASPTCLAKMEPITSPADLFGRPRLSPEDSWWQIWAEAFGVPLVEAGRNTGIRLDSQLMEGNAAIAGHGLAILNPVLWRQQIAAGQLVRAWPGVAREGRTYWLAYAEPKRNTPKIRAFRDWVFAEMARDAQDDPDGQFVPEAEAA
jgi:LysR family glycine cleavage system transcriptional activator